MAYRRQKLHILRQRFRSLRCYVSATKGSSGGPFEARGRSLARKFPPTCGYVRPSASENSSIRRVLWKRVDEVEFAVAALRAPARFYGSRNRGSFRRKTWRIVEGFIRPAPQERC